MSFRRWHIFAALGASLAIHGAVDLWMQEADDKLEIAGITSTQIDIIGNAFADMRMEGGEEIEEVAVAAPPTPVKALKQAVLKPVEQPELQPSVADESTMAAAIAETQTASAIIAAAAVDSPRADQMASAKAAEPQQPETDVHQPEAIVTEVAPAKVTPTVTAQSTEAKPVEQAEQPQVEPIETAALIRPIEPVPTPTPKPAQKMKSVEKKKPPQKKQRAQKGDRGKSAQTAKKGKSEGSRTGGQQSTGKAKKGTGNASVSNYPGKVTRKLKRSVRYPKKARSKRLTGTTLVRFRVSANGAVSAVGISQSSGSKVLDAAALASVKRAAPFPKIPAAAGRETWNFTVPLHFKP